MEKNLWQFLKKIHAALFLHCTLNLFSSEVMQKGSNFVRGYWQPSGKFVMGCQRVLPALWQVPQRVLATLQTAHISEVVANDLWSIAEDDDYPLEHWQNWWITSKYIWKGLSPLTWKGAPFLQYLWKIVTFKIQEETDSVKIIRGLSASYPIFMFITNCSFQSRETVRVIVLAQALLHWCVLDDSL